MSLYINIINRMKGRTGSYFATVSRSGARAYSLSGGVRALSVQAGQRKVSILHEVEKRKHTYIPPTQQMTEEHSTRAVSLILPTSPLKPNTVPQPMPLQQEEPDLGYDRKKVLIACLFSLLTTQTLFLNVENILPTYIPDQHPKLDSMKVAFILRYDSLI